MTRIGLARSGCSAPHARASWICHAYRLMTNHYYVVVETIKGDLALEACVISG
jgi:hypothetical protein